LVYSKSELFKAKIKGKERKYYETDDLPGRSWRIHGMTTQRTANERPNSDFALINPKNGEKYPVNPNAVWRITKDSYKEFLKEKRIVFPGDYDFLDISQPVLRYFKDEDLKNDGESFGYAAVSTLLPVSVGMTLDGTKEMAELFENRIFSFPKPKNLIKFLIEISTDITKDIVLDFFAGSGTTAHAVIELNKENESRRKFILVQIPEATDEKSDAYKAGYKTISDICIERVKRAGKKLKDGAKDLDVGFKVFRLASSHFPENTFAPDPDKSDEQNIKALEEYIKKATSQKSLFRDGVMDLVYEIALKDGFELTLTMEEAKEFNKNTIYKVADSYKEAFICVDDSLEDTTIRQLDQHKGSRFICLHTSVNTTKKWNLQNVLGSNLWLI
jgi:adenine-specific DNA-methyltransferase